MSNFRVCAGSLQAWYGFSTGVGLVLRLTFSLKTPGLNSLRRSYIFPCLTSSISSWGNRSPGCGWTHSSRGCRGFAHIGITHVVDTRSEYCDDVHALGREQIELLYLPTADTQPLTIEQLMQGAKWVNERLEQGGRVLIHCEHGVGRSVLLTCAVLVYDGMHGQDALQLVQVKRWQAAPIHRQVERLREFEKALDGQQSA